MTKLVENEIKEYLEIALVEEKLANFTFELAGASKKGDGYMGDIYFVKVSGEKEDGTKKVYNLVLKCGKKSQSLRDSVPVREAFLNEIIFYSKILPAFTKFQKEKAIEDVFDSVPKCYHAFALENTEVIVLENIKEKGYNLWDRTQPQTRNHIDLIMKGYAKYHAVSLAFSDQQPELFAELTKDLHNVIDQLIESADMHELIAIVFDDLYQLLKNEMNAEVLKNLMKLKDELKYVIGDMKQEKCVRVFTHGDCWNNNFMFKPSERGEKHPQKAVYLDFQICNLSTLVSDLSYYIYTCISEEDIRDLDAILEKYHKNLSENLEKLGSNAENIYPYDVFRSEWKRFSKYGFAMMPMIIKVCLYDEDETFDFGEEAGKGKNVMERFVSKIKNEEAFKLRIKYLLEGAVKIGTLNYSS